MWLHHQPFHPIRPTLPHIKLRACTHRLHSMHTHLHMFRKNIRAGKKTLSCVLESAAGLIEKWKIKSVHFIWSWAIFQITNVSTSTTQTHTSTPHPHISCSSINLNHMRKSSPPTTISTSVTHTHTNTHTDTQAMAMSHFHTSAALPFNQWNFC